MFKCCDASVRSACRYTPLPAGTRHFQQVWIYCSGGFCVEPEVTEAASVNVDGWNRFTCYVTSLIQFLMKNPDSEVSDGSAGLLLFILC